MQRSDTGYCGWLLEVMAGWASVSARWVITRRLSMNLPSTLRSGPSAILVPFSLGADIKSPTMLIAARMYSVPEADKFPATCHDGMLLSRAG